MEKAREQEQQHKPTNRRKNKQQQQRKVQEQSSNQRKAILPKNILHEVQDQRFKDAVKHEMIRQGSRSKMQGQ